MGRQGHKHGARNISHKSIRPRNTGSTASGPWEHRAMSIRTQEYKVSSIRTLGTQGHEHQDPGASGFRTYNWECQTWNKAWSNTLDIETWGKNIMPRSVCLKVTEPGA